MIGKKVKLCKIIIVHGSFKTKVQKQHKASFHTKENIPIAIFWITNQPIKYFQGGLHILTNASFVTGRVKAARAIVKQLKAIHRSMMYCK